MATIGDSRRIEGGTLHENENVFKKGGTKRRILEYSIESLLGRTFENLSEGGKIPEYPQQV